MAQRLWLSETAGIQEIQEDEAKPVMSGLVRSDLCPTVVELTRWQFMKRRQKGCEPSAAASCRKRLEAAVRPARVGVGWAFPLN